MHIMIDTMGFIHQFELTTPSPVSVVSFGTDHQLAVGSGEDLT